MFAYFTIFITLFSIVATVLPFSKSEIWWIRVFDFPRVQILVMCLLSLALTGLDASIHYQLYYQIALVFCIGYQIFKIYPYTQLARNQVKNSHHRSNEDGVLSILFSNVLMTNRKSEKCRKLIRKMQPDIILVVEADKWWQKELAEFETTHPYTLHAPLGNTYGMLFYSKFKLHHSEIKYLLRHDIPSLHCVVELRNGTKVKFFGVHPRPPAPGESSSSLQRDAELVLVGKEAKRSSHPVIVAGDLNDVAWSHTTHLFQKVSGLLDPRIGRGLFSTFNAKQKIFRWPLDHVFHSKDFKLIEMKRLDYIDSDHFPIFIKLSYEPENTSDQHAEVLTKSDAAEADQKVEDLKQEN